MKLSRDAFNRAKSGIFKYGRKLEHLRFHHHFVEPILEEVVAELAAYQNPDGGFGHAIEPDFWLPDSSPMATTVGLQIAVELELEASHPVVRAALQYLRSTYDADLRGWIATPLSVNDHPHAPWWHRDPDTKVDSMSLRLNPSAEIVGYLLRWGEDDFQQWVQDLIERIDVLEPHQLLCCLRLADSPGLVEKHREALFALISRAAATAIETDSAKWDGYCIKPLSAIPTPDARLAQRFSGAVDKQMDYEIGRQSDRMGVWLPHWSWGESFPRAWQKAREHWAGIITLEMLLSFQAFGRLA